MSNVEDIFRHIMFETVVFYTYHVSYKVFEVFQCFFIFFSRYYLISALIDSERPAVNQRTRLNYRTRSFIIAYGTCFILISIQNDRRHGVSATLSL